MAEVNGIRAHVRERYAEAARAASGGMYREARAEAKAACCEPTDKADWPDGARAPGACDCS